MMEELMLENIETRICVTITAVTTLLAFWLVYRRRNETIPSKQIILSFVYGAVLVCFIYACDWWPWYWPRNPFAEGTLANELHSYFGSALLEEWHCKFLAMLLVTPRKQKIESKYHTISIAASVAIGFAFVENLMYAERNDWDVLISLVRILCTIDHFNYGVVMGWFYGCAKQQFTYSKRMSGIICLIMAVLAPTIIHCITNTTLAAQWSPSIIRLLCWLVVKMMFSLLSLRLIKKALRELEAV